MLRGYRVQLARGLTDESEPSADADPAYLQELTGPHGGDPLVVTSQADHRMHLHTTTYLCNPITAPSRRASAAPYCRRLRGSISTACTEPMSAGATTV